MSNNPQSDLNAIENVRIDDAGRFKYILIKLSGNGVESRHVVRGFGWAEYHADILEDFEKKEAASRQIKVECVGGGRILHEPNKKEILVYGYSLGFGRADHQTAVDLLKAHYTDYANITFSNEGY